MKLTRNFTMQTTVINITLVGLSLIGSMVNAMPNRNNVIAGSGYNYNYNYNYHNFLPQAGQGTMYRANTKVSYPSASNNNNIRSTSYKKPIKRNQAEGQRNRVQRPRYNTNNNDHYNSNYNKPERGSYGQGDNSPSNKKLNFNLNKMLELVNIERANAPYPARPLRINNKLTQAAQFQSNYQLKINRMQHEGPSSARDVGDRAKMFSYRYSNIGENVANADLNIIQVMKCWMQSPCHRASILNPAFKEFGAAISGKYWTQVFGVKMGEGNSYGYNPNQGQCNPNNHTPYQCTL